MPTFKPMLAGTVEDVNLVQFPVLVSPKLDGIRATVRGGKLLARSGHLIPNKHVQAQFGRHRFEGLDGELTCGKPTAPDVFQRSSSACMGVAGTPVVQFNVFDCVENDTPVQPFTARLVVARKLIESHELHAMDIMCKMVAHVTVRSVDDLLSYESKVLASGYEGVMLRSPDGLYKWGRSTMREGALLKLKRFVDAEAEIIGVFEQMHNTNAATLGSGMHSLKRTSHKAGMVGKGVLGGFVCRTSAGVEFRVATGITDAQRREWWPGSETRAAAHWVGKYLKYKSQPVGVKLAPRLPVFLGFRDKLDM